MSITWIRHKSRIFSLEYKPCRNPSRRVKCSYWLAISWPGATRPERSKNKLLLHLQKNKEGNLLKTLLQLNRRQKRRKEQLRIRAKRKIHRNRLRDRQNKRRSQYNTLFTKTVTMPIGCLCQNTATLNRSKKRSFPSKSKTSRSLLYAQVSSTAVVRIPSTSCSKQLGCSNLNNYPIWEMETTKYQLFI